MSRSVSKTKIKLAFLLDENVDIRVTSFLKKRGFIADICPKGITNGELELLARKQKSILVTNDKDFTNPVLHNTAGSHGMVVLRIHPSTIQNTSSALANLFSEVLPSDFADSLIIVTPLGIERNK